MESKVMMTFGSVYEAPDVQVMEVLVEHGFQNSFGVESSPIMLDYSEDFNEFQ